MEIWKETVSGWGHSGCRHSYQDDARSRELLGEIHESTRFRNEDPSGLQTEPVEARYVGAWLSLVERPVRDRKVAGPNPVAPTILKLPSPEFLWWRVSTPSEVGQPRWGSALPDDVKGPIVDSALL